MARILSALMFLLACGTAQAANYSDLWWNPLESGWGLTIADHETNLFGVWYTYRADGKPVWYSIPGGTFSSDRRTFSGDIYQTRGPSYANAAFDPSLVVATRVGSAVIDFAPAGQPAGSALFTYNVNGVTKSSRIERQSFGNAAPRWGSDFTDLWFNPAQSGWGVALAQHGNNVFGVWYAYDTDGQPLWFALPGVQFSSATSFSAKLYTASGPYYGNASFDPASVKVSEVGSATFNVDVMAGNATSQCDAGTASFSPAVNTASGIVQYQRTACTQRFGNARPVSANVALQPKRCSGTYTIVATEPSGCMNVGSTHTFAGTLTLDGIDWTRAGHQAGSLTLTNLPWLFIPLGDDGMMMGMMMGMGMGPSVCMPQTLSTLTVPIDFTLANGVEGLSTSGAFDSSAGKLTYDVAVTPGSIGGHLTYTGGAYYTQPFTESGSFSCTAN